VPLLTKLDAGGDAVVLRWSVRPALSPVTLRPARGGGGGGGDDDDVVVVGDDDCANANANANADEEASAEMSRFLKSLKSFNGANGGRLFLQTCVLAGSDYSISLPGIGIVAAAGLVSKFRTFPDEARLGCIVRFLRRGAAAKAKKRGKAAAGLKAEDIPEDYTEQLERAEMAFMEQPVFVADAPDAEEAPEGPSATLRITGCMRLSAALAHGYKNRISAMLGPSPSPHPHPNPYPNPNPGPGDDLDAVVDAFADEPTEAPAATDEHARVAGALIEPPYVEGVANGTLDPETLSKRAPPVMPLNTKHRTNAVAPRIVQPRNRGRLGGGRVEPTRTTIDELWLRSGSSGGVSGSSSGASAAVRASSAPTAAELEQQKLEAKSAAEEGCRSAMTQIFGAKRSKAPKPPPPPRDENAAAAHPDPNPNATPEPQPEPEPKPKPRHNPFAVQRRSDDNKNKTRREKQIRSTSLFGKATGVGGVGIGGSGSGSGSSKAARPRPISGKDGVKKRRIAASLAAALGSLTGGGDGAATPAAGPKTQSSLASMFKKKA